MADIRTYRKISSAKAAANGNPIISMSIPSDIQGAKDTTIYAVLPNHGGAKFAEFCVIRSDGMKTGYVSAGKLDALGNGNWAEGNDDRNPNTAFPVPTPPIK